MFKHGDHEHTVPFISESDPCYTAEAQPVAPVDAWIDPEGGFHPVTHCGHDKWAETFHQTWTLEPRGWYHISGGLIIKMRPPTQAQIDTMFDLMQSYKSDDHSRKYVADRFENMFRDLLADQVEDAYAG